MSVFKDKIAIVTGAGSGIGKALAEDLAARGSHVIASDVNAERIEAVGEGIRESGGKVTSLTIDVTDYDAVKKMVDDAITDHGRLDYIFNNAGIALGGEARDVTIDDWRTVLDVNLMGVVNGVAAAYPLMAKQGSGHIVNTSSIEGLVPFPFTASYVASKYAVVGLSNSIRAEGRDLGVKVSAVCPGYIFTPIFEESKTVNFNLQMAFDWVPKSLGLTPEDCARRILKGVEKNKSIIVVSFLAKFLYAIQRVSPDLSISLMARTVRKQRENGIRLDSEYQAGG